MKVQNVNFVAQGKVAVEAGELDPPKANEVLVETEASVISPGTELAYLHQMENARWPMPGMNNGYCSCGKVIAVGGEVKDLAVGHRVVALARHASHFVTEAASAYPVHDGMSPMDAAAFTLGAIAMQGVRKGRVRLGQSVAVIGLGPIGNLAGQIAKAAGATAVVGIDPVKWRQGVALKSGFNAVADSAGAAPLERFYRTKKNEGFDVVIEATGSPIPIVDAFRLTRRLGHTVLLGSTRGVTEKVDFYNDVHRKGITVVGGHNGARPPADDSDAFSTLPTDIRTVLDLIADGRIVMQPLISAVVPPGEAPKAYERLSARNEELMTVGLKWR